MSPRIFRKKAKLSPAAVERHETIIHDKFFEALVNREYKRVVQRGQVYLDYTGGNLYAECQLREHYELLKDNVFGNPHSTNPTSQLATHLVDTARQKVLDFFKAEDYYCVFTQNASGALKIVGECYPFDDRSALLLLADNHNSVNGIREFCHRKKGHFTYCPIQYEDLRVNHGQLRALLQAKEGCSHKLFGFPAQSNVSGVRHDLGWIAEAQELGWDVLLDAAAYVPTSRLDLSKDKPDFVSVSFYKIFGYPTGIGCLLVKKSKYWKLQKPWFAGGTVTLASVQSASHFLMENHERFEDGTINYLDLPAISTGLDYISSIGIDRIHERVSGLMDYLYLRLRDIRHETGQRVVKIFGPEGRKDSGGTVIMNFFDSEGQPYPFGMIEQMTNQRKISIRSGCFCNPGIDEVNSCLTTEELSKYFSSREKGNFTDMVHYLNKMRGAVRVSVGLATRRHDLDEFIAFAEDLRDTRIASN